MATSSVETVQSPADKFKLAGAALLVVVGLVAYYMASKQGALVQWAALLVFLIAAVALGLSADSGRALIAFGQESTREARKVVWPTRKEAMQMTAYVFGFVLLMAIFLWLTDKTLEWVLYDLFLGWKK